MMRFTHQSTFADWKRRPTGFLMSTADCKFDCTVSIRYYEGGTSACYFWDKDGGGFDTAWLVRKGIYFD
jgi:hypothetical protein